MAKVSTRRSASTDALAIPGEVHSFVSMNQKGNWLANQTRPDLSILVSTSQQKMPSPTVGNIRQGNMLVRRSQQYSELAVTYHSIPCDQLSFLLHTDYSSKESSNMGHTQGGYIIGTTNKDMEKGLCAPWAPAVWRSYRVRRVVNSTLSGESSCLIDGLGHLEWLLSFFAFGFFRGFTLENRDRFIGKFQAVAVIDCKSVYDHICKIGSPSGVVDKRCAIDLAIAKESLSRLSATLRWGPTSLMLADCLTKDKAEPADLLRACIRHGVCQLADEVTVLARAATERQHRKALTTSTRSATTTRSGQVPREDVDQRLAREGRQRTFDVDLSRQHGQHPDPLVSSSGGRVEGIPSRAGVLVCGSLSRGQLHGREGSREVPGGHLVSPPPGLV